ncbi:TDP-N-acetylfucosamine:lipid II N-acetylfucosaminyltransferase [Halosquirtibacter laminarini]|uniref:TDP-N-acetylfucosamine:lipid II N-acetylfucosaminyltransferase n=1 Tax=Halosquirtibacter laminarini TaxID=3374600 RepID=A0AC61NHA0_9BACT|nr:TDP-N-acetylfucosamine:lipid II N-acetylfucosaminyltransferase [Prolixibacteraceae bacterium]
MNNKILHLAMDEKFIDASNWLFEQAFPEENDLIITVKNPNQSLKHVTLTKNTRIVSLRYLLKEILPLLPKYDCVILHSLPFQFAQIVLASPNTCFVWAYFGFEVYRNQEMGLLEKYGQKTQLLCKTTIQDKIHQHIRNLYYRLKYKLPSSDNAVRLAAKHIDFFATQIREEHEMLCNHHIIGETSRWMNFSYYPIEFILEKICNESIQGENILVGNSAFHSNNHLEVFDMLRNIFLSADQQIIVPLSYGDDHYASQIHKEGSTIFGDKFTPLLNFMPLAEYNQIVQQCGYVIMNHYRQQAMGNIIISLWLGAKLFLDTRNNIYHFFKRIGITLFEMKELKKESSLTTPLTKAQKEKNREILKQHLSTEQIIQSLQQHLNPRVTISN